MVSYVKVHVYCVFDYFLFNLVSTSAGELRETACLLCVWLFSLQSCLHLRESACLLCVWLFSLQSCLHFRWVTWKCMFIVCLTIFSSILSPLQPVSYVKLHVYCVFLSCPHFSLTWKSCLHFSRWVTWKCMFIVCIWLFSSSILSLLQTVSYVKVHVYCVFDYFLFNLVSTSVSELCKSAWLFCVWLFSSQSCLHFSRWVTWKRMFIVYLTIFSLFLSPLQSVSYVKVHVYCVFDYFLFNLVSTSVGELCESTCLLCVWLILYSLRMWVMKEHVYCVFDFFSLQSSLHLSMWVT